MSGDHQRRALKEIPGTLKEITANVRRRLDTDTEEGRRLWAQLLEATRKVQRATEDLKGQMLLGDIGDDFEEEGES